MRWDELTREQPALAGPVERRLLEPGVALVVTVRSDGTPRLSPVEPLVWAGGLWLSMMEGSLKARDLRRDPRLLVHSIVTDRDGQAGEAKVRGTGHEVADVAEQEAYATAAEAALGWRAVVGRFHLFEVDVAHVALVSYAESGDQHVASWPPAREFVRRSTTPTSVGEPEPVNDLVRVSGRLGRAVGDGAAG